MLSSGTYISFNWMCVRLQKYIIKIGASVFMINPTHIRRLLIIACSGACILYGFCFFWHALCFVVLSGMIASIKTVYDNVVTAYIIHTLGVAGFIWFGNDINQMLLKNRI